MSHIDYVFFEPPVGMAVFKVIHQADTVGHHLKEVQDSVADLSRFGRMVKLVNYTPTAGTPDVLGHIDQLSKGRLPEPIRAALELSLPQAGAGAKKAKAAKNSDKNIILAVPDRFLAVAIRNALPGIGCETPDTSAVAASLLRGIRAFYPSLIEHMSRDDMDTISAVTGTVFSRGRVKYSAQRDDKYIIAAITTLESLDKSLNLFGMRVREWYGAHFPELYNLVRDPVPYVRLVLAIGNKVSLSMSEPGRVRDLTDIVGEDSDMAEAIVRAARMSVGVDLRPEDLQKIELLANTFLVQAATRACAAQYLETKLTLVCPNLHIILGTVLTARMIAQAGSLKELAKKPSSTLQILGAEKALFRALKTKGNTPKYGILFHCSYISKASVRDKGRIARYVSNKCSMAARIDAFAQDPSTIYGEAFKEQIEERVRFLSTGEKMRTNGEVLDRIMEALGAEAADLMIGEHMDEDGMEVDPPAGHEDDKAARKAKKVAEHADKKTEKKKRKSGGDEGKADAVPDREAERTPDKKSKRKSAPDQEDGERKKVKKQK